MAHLGTRRRVEPLSHARPHPRRRPRLLHVQSLSHDCLLGENAFQQVNQPREVFGQQVAALRFTDPRVHALLNALVAFRLLLLGLANHELRAIFDADPAKIGTNLNKGGG